MTSRSPETKLSTASTVADPAGIELSSTTTPTDAPATTPPTTPTTAMQNGAPPTTPATTPVVERSCGETQKPILHVVFDQPQIPQNTGNAIRLAACTGTTLHLAKPYLFDFTDRNLKRAGLDYHDMAVVQQHESLDAALTALTGCSADQTSGNADGPSVSADASSGNADQTSGNAAAPRVFAFSSHATRNFTEIEYCPGDILLFGCESDGLSEEVLADPRITEKLRIPMLPSRRSMNLANCASIAVYEAWRQLDFHGGH